MSRWEYSIEKPMSHDEYYFVPRYPRHVACAFIAVDYDHRDVSPEEELSIPYQKWIEEAIQSFAKHWGGVWTTRSFCARFKRRKDGIVSSPSLPSDIIAG